MIPPPTQLPSKGAGETVTIKFDFTSEIGVETIQSATAAARLLAGADASPSFVLNGAPQFTPGATFALQSVKGGVPGAVYLITVTVVAPSQTLDLHAVLPIRTAT